MPDIAADTTVINMESFSALGMNQSDLESGGVHPISSFRMKTTYGTAIVISWINILINFPNSCCLVLTQRGSALCLNIIGSRSLKDNLHQCDGDLQATTAYTKEW